MGSCETNMTLALEFCDRSDDIEACAAVKHGMSQKLHVSSMRGIEPAGLEKNSIHSIAT